MPLGWCNTDINPEKRVAPHWHFNHFHDLSSEARVKGVMLRWWQPRHDGAGHDQWALDHVEVVLWVPNSQLASGSFLPPPKLAPHRALICPRRYLWLRLNCTNGSLCTPPSHSDRVSTQVCTDCHPQLNSWQITFFYMLIAASGVRQSGKKTYCSMLCGDG